MRGFGDLSSSSRLKKVAARAAITIPTKYQNEQNSKLAGRDSPAQHQPAPRRCQGVREFGDCIPEMYLEQIRKKYLVKFKVTTSTIRRRFASSSSTD